MRAQERAAAGKAKGLAAIRGEEPLAGNLPARQQTRDVVARAVGLSGSTYERARQVVEAAQEDPARFGDLPAVGHWWDSAGQKQPISAAPRNT